MNAGLYEANDRAMARCEAAWLRDPREDDDAPDAETDARECLRAVEDAGAAVVRRSGEYRVVLHGEVLAAHGTHDGAVEAGARALDAMGQRPPWEADWTEADAVDRAPQAEGLR